MNDTLPSPGPSCGQYAEWPEDGLEDLEVSLESGEISEPMYRRACALLDDLEGLGTACVAVVSDGGICVDVENGDKELMLVFAPFSEYGEETQLMFRLNSNIHPRLAGFVTSESGLDNLYEWMRTGYCDPAGLHLGRSHDQCA